MSFAINFSLYLIFASSVTTLTHSLAIFSFADWTISIMEQSPHPSQPPTPLAPPPTPVTLDHIEGVAVTPRAEVQQQLSHASTDSLMGNLSDTDAVKSATTVVLEGGAAAVGGDGGEGGEGGGEDDWYPRDNDEELEVGLHAMEVMLHK